jgi:hypothetical protein
MNNLTIGKKYHITNQYYNSSNEWILDRTERGEDSIISYVFKLRQMEFYITKINDFEFEEVV